MRVWATTGRTPELPLASILAWISIIARTTSSGSGSSTPTPHSTIKFRDSLRAPGADSPVGQRAKPSVDPINDFAVLATDGATHS